LRFFSRDQDISRSDEQADVQADVDPYSLVQKYLDAIAGNIKKVCMLFLVAEACNSSLLMLTSLDTAGSWVIYTS